MAGTRRRVQPGQRITSRYAVPQQPEEDRPETIYNAPRRDTPAYRQFLKRGSERIGTHTATETGAKDMARRGEIKRLTDMKGWLGREEQRRKAKRMRNLT